MRNYRDLLVWERAHGLTLALYKATRGFPEEEKFGLKSQIRRAAASIGANLAEGCGKYSDGEMRRFVLIAMGSASELDYHLLLARDLGMLSQPAYTALQDDLSGVRRMLTSFVQRLRAKSQKPYRVENSYGSSNELD